MNYFGPKAKVAEPKILDWDEYTATLSDLEKRNLSRNQSRDLGKIRMKLEKMTEKYGGNFALYSAFPNFVNHTMQHSLFGGGIEFRETTAGKVLGRQWDNHFQAIQGNVTIT